MNNIYGNHIGRSQGQGGGSFALDQANAKQSPAQHQRIVTTIPDGNSRFRTNFKKIIEFALVLAIAGDHRHSAGQAGKCINHRTVGVGGEHMNLKLISEAAQPLGHARQQFTVYGESAVIVEEKMTNDQGLSPGYGDFQHGEQVMPIRGATKSTRLFLQQVKVDGLGKNEDGAVVLG
jgi:hypothetical protein